MSKLAQFILAAVCFTVPSFAQTFTVTITANEKGKPISPRLFGIFFEDLNYAADGGLYAEMVQNGSFEYSPLDQTDWNALTAWQLSQHGGSGTLYIGDARPLHPNNPRYLEFHCRCTNPDSAVALSNAGFDGMVFSADRLYDFSVFARRQPRCTLTIQVRLESADGGLLAEGQIPSLTEDWKQYTLSLQPNQSVTSGRLTLLVHGQGVLYLDKVSLFPQDTFQKRKNGLRADLAQVIADLHPRFVRFPGGCLVHGDGLNNLYRWKNTIGPLEQRKEQKNIWRYHQSVGLGYFEYFQFCEDIGAEPLPIVAAGVSCQNTDRYWGLGQQAIPMENMADYVQEVLDLIEWANGSPDSEWGSKRAQAGHPAPFGLKYLGIGNEDAQTPAFRERFEMLYKAVKEKYPDITVIGTVGPGPDGYDYEEGWKFARTLSLEMVDEHYYKPPQWFWDHLNRYDTYSRSSSKVYLGEYAAHEPGRRNTLRSALAEAAYMTALERNGDLVQMASYAPLLGKQGHTQWNPNLIYFTNTQVLKTANYYVQQLFSTNAGDSFLPADWNGGTLPATLAFSAVRESRTGDIILKIVNGGSSAHSLRFRLGGLDAAMLNASQTVLTDEDPSAFNSFENPRRIIPQTSSLNLQPEFEYTTTPFSLTILRIQNPR